jgi:hypothetical protein
MQWPLVAEFTFNYNDTKVDTTGATTDFASVATTKFDCINLPPNAIVIGGDVTTETAATGSTAYNISVGDSANETRYLTATDRTAVGRTALTLTGYVGAGEQIRITVSPTVATATSGKFTLRVMYIIRNRTTESQTS